MQQTACLHYERPVAVSSHVAILLPQRHVPSRRELVVVPKDGLQQPGSVHTHCVHPVSVYGPVELLLVELTEIKDR